MRAILSVQTALGSGAECPLQFRDFAPGRRSLPPHAQRASGTPERHRRQRHREPLEIGVAAAAAVESGVACGGGYRTDSSYSARGRSGAGETGAVVAR